MQKRVIFKNTVILLNNLIIFILNGNPNLLLS